MGDETYTRRQSPCPCGKGFAVAHHTTPDHGWGGGWTSYGLECGECQKTHEVENSTIYIKSERIALTAARDAHRKASAQLYELIAPLVDKHFEPFASKPMTRQLAEMQRLGISIMNIRDYRASCNYGRRFSELSRAMKNPTWVRTLVNNAGINDEFEPLEENYLQTLVKQEQIEKDMQRVEIPPMRLIG